MVLRFRILCLHDLKRIGLYINLYIYRHSAKSIIKIINVFNNNKRDRGLSIRIGPWVLLLN